MVALFFMGVCGLFQAEKRGVDSLTVHQIRLTCAVHSEAPGASLYSDYPNQ